VCRAGGRAVFFLAVAIPLAAADVPLFPTPLHLVRRIEDPIANRTFQVDEYCAGNRIVTVDAYKTAIADYDRRELLEIDRAASTYSVASFDEIAASNTLTGPAAETTTWKTTPVGLKANGDAFEIASDTMRIVLAVDRHYALSRQAFDALTGASYPNHPSAQHDAVARAAALTTNAITIAAIPDSYGIPVEQSITFDASRGQHVTIRNLILTITNELAPTDVLAIPAGGKLVPSRAARMRKSLEELKDPAPHP